MKRLLSAVFAAVVAAPAFAGNVSASVGISQRLIASPTGIEVGALGADRSARRSYRGAESLV